MTNAKLIKKSFRSLMTMMIFAGVVAMCGSFIDGVVIGNFLGADHMASFGYAAPVFMIIAAVAGIFANGGKALCSAYLGEVALVSCDSPIKKTGILFYNTLFDENASCHLAFGSAYPNCVRGGEKLDEDGQKALGLNQSMNHVDFMVGTDDLSIVGRTHDGREIPVFIDGRFAF